MLPFCTFGEFSNDTDSFSPGKAWWLEENAEELRETNQVLYVEAMASCTAITYVHGSLIGDPLDVKMFEATGWVLDEPDGKQASDNELLIGTMYPYDLGDR
jgi:hypothetical protein